MLTLCATISSEINPKTVERNFGFFVGVNGTHLPAKSRLRFAAKDAIEMAWRYAEELGVILPANMYLLLDGSIAPDSDEEAHLVWLIRRGVHIERNATCEDIQR